jgi:hypothetical protein
MKVYEDYSQAQGLDTESTLKLGDDGRFSYEESWKDYTNVALYGGAEGRWRQDGDAVIFHTESADGTLPHRWAVGEELRAVEQGDTLVFPDGLMLRAPPEREEAIPVHNTGLKPLTVVPEPSGMRHLVEPGEQARVVAAPTPPVAPPAPATLPVTRYPRFKLPTPPPEIAALIRRRVEELPGRGLPGWLVSLCEEHCAIPLHSTQFDLWVLRPDGHVLCIDHDSVARWAEPETDPERAYAAVAQGARTYPELSRLLSTAPEGFRQCELCGGVGWTKAPGAQYADGCPRCAGFGWYVPRQNR